MLATYVQHKSLKHVTLFFEQAALDLVLDSR
jgi:hypothetical protein